MSIVQKHIYQAEGDSAMISLWDWIESLPEIQRIAWCRAHARQRALIKAQIDAGNLVEDLTNGQIWTWKDQASADAFTNDPKYQLWFNRYIEENNLTYQLITE
ncbi:hypothetical protein UFOVP112_279 [uncultured Caudovirales phage]|uniref:Uncharacterized protein n=1 Tax=uncultured Caudovirales phage TaxID=2100421 RepID=A0A6J5L4F5_9CAUD|nr:hypothetical protein UFOVP112_279 [uncultured Caudovirales phage]